MALLGRAVPAGALFGMPEAARLVDEALRALAMAVTNLCVGLWPSRTP
ncbi:hypothetical protein [Nonomuraea sp. SYSU D8015]|nr:hypothetical protein [Nonomuraea sp. SYSU D8015]